MQEIIVPVGESVKNLANYLKKQFPIGYVRKLFRKNGVRLNGRRAKADEPIHDGDRIQLYIPFEAQSPKPADKISLPEIETVYEDEMLLVLNKPAGIAVHEGKTVLKRDTIAGMIEKKYQASKFRPKLVHRLDQDTSGLLLLAKSEGALAELENQFETGASEKEYLCLVAGRPHANEGKIDFPLPGRDGTPVRALTHFHVVKRYPETTLVRVSIETGRLHQIRLHFAKLRHPVVMDDQHGDFDFNKRFRKSYGLKRQFLHAAKLTINYRGKGYSWSAPLAEDLARTLKRLENEIK
ncbi:MAG: Pseudouridine synthase [Deltaproteobacteria bacterium]|nr:Pseudouridine synthase [Deltaproteobacteria bacterium]